MSRSRASVRRFAPWVLGALALCIGTVAAARGGTGGGTAPGPTAGTATSSGTVAGDILVQLRSSAALPALLTKYSMTLVDRFGSRPIFRLKVAATTTVATALAALALEPEVLIAEANQLHDSPEAKRNVVWAIGTAQSYAAQWAPQAMRLAEAQAVSTGAGVRVAVLDTGVDRSHPALAGRLLPGFDFVDFDTDPSEVGTTADAGYGHGTHVAGLVAMVAPQAKIMPLRVLDAAGRGNTWVLAQALLYALDPDGNPATDDGAQVINMSLGTATRTALLDTIGNLASCTPPDPTIPTIAFEDAGYNDDKTRCASSRGAVMIAAAGNDASRLRQYPAAEGVYGLLAVTASQSTGTLATFANNGPWVDLAAPGDLITSTVPGGYGTWSGTSMSAPLAAGAAALVLAAQPALASRDVTRVLLRTTAALCGTRLRQIDTAAALGLGAAPLRTCN